MRMSDGAAQQAATAASSSVDAAEVARFARLADEWWDPAGKFRPLHKFNPVRLAFLRAQFLEHFGRDAEALRPFAGLSLLEIGCGGGLVAEPMTRLGFAVTGIDAADETVMTARSHAEATGLAIDYRPITVEAL